MLVVVPYTNGKNLKSRYPSIEMDRTKVHTLSQCLDTIESMEKVCVDKFKPHVCKNLHTYYLHYCYKTFEPSPTPRPNPSLENTYPSEGK